MNYGIVYVVMCEGEIEYVTKDEDRADGFVFSKHLSDRDDVLEEWDNDDPSEEELYEASYEAGFYGDHYEVEEVDLSDMDENDIVRIQGDYEIRVSELWAMLDVNE